MKKIKVIALILVIAILLAFFQLSFIGSVNNTKEDYSHLFKNIYNQNKNFGNVPITKIAMLGSHDAMSYNISYFSKADTTRGRTRKDNFASNPFLFVLAKGNIVRLSKTQTLNPYEQMKAGSRYLDVRITDIDSEFYTSHGLVSDTLKNSFTYVLKFLNDNPGEFVIINILYYYKDTRSWDELCDFIKTIEYEGKNLFDYVNYDTHNTDLSLLTYNKLTDNGNKAGVVFVSREYDGSKYKNYFAFNHILNNNCKIGNYSLIDEKINEIVEDSKTYDDTYLKVNQTQITPDAKSILNVFANWSLINISDKHNSVVVKNNNYKEWIENMPIYLTDNVTSNKDNFNKILNETIIEYNLNIANKYAKGDNDER